MKILLTNTVGYIKGIERHFSCGRFGCTLPIPYSIGGKNSKIKMSRHYNAYPWSLGYASAILKRDSTETIKAIDAQAKDYNEDDFTAAVNVFKPDLMVVDLPTISFALCMDILKKLKHDMKCILIIVGLHASGLPKDVLREYGFIDYIITGDYGLPLLEFVKGKVTEVPNLYYRSNNEIRKTKFKTEFGDFDNLPYPDREDLDYRDYHDFEITDRPAIHMVTSRGCPFQCSYCNVRVFWPEGFYWKRSVKKVVDEMEYVKEKFGAKQIYFDDDIMTFDAQRMINFAHEILKRKLKIPWTFMGDVNIKEDIIKILVQAGAVGLKFGIESINTRTLNYIHKRWINRDKIINFVAMCKRNKLWTHGDFIIGLPYENNKSINNMLQFLINIDLDSIQVYSAQPLPGTPFYHTAKENGWLVAKEWIEYDGNYSSPLSYPWLKKDEIEFMLRKIQKEWGLKVFKRYLKSPPKFLRYLRARGFAYTLKKIITVLKRLLCEEELFISGM